ncbi:hybrid sensor histidine kinase/response regulator [Mesorhizobium xinjiangense]|uniref:hybrid sensor histidine kinase/response regulator n=1 Tax=Mesorhizobium xinjiangense TaxID=2678685 RepID=UPI001F22734F|nr:hybrid sensor histidine kinase/response regulator [Mesorhizobium xinjiangense]
MNAIDFETDDFAAWGTVHNVKIRDALIEFLYRQSRAIIFANFAIPFVVAYIFRDAVPRTWLVNWLAAMVAVTTVRLLAIRLFARRQSIAGSAMHWAWLAAGFSWVSSMLWGAVGWVGFDPGTPHLFTFTVVVLTGLLCGAIPSLSAFPPAYLGSIAAMLTPAVLRCIAGEGEDYHAYLFFLACLAGVNLYYCRNTYWSLYETIRLRFENEGLIESLEKERDAAAAADRAKTRFLAAASHDLRQPIHALGLLNTTFGALAERGDVRAEDARSLAARTKSVTSNLAGLLDSLLDISRLDAGVATPAREPVCLRDLINGLRTEYSGMAEECGLDWRAVGSSAFVDSDPMMLKRILGNLLSNAFRYTPEGRVLLGCRRRGAEIEIQVYDTGIGIPADQQSAIFDEFYQLHNPERDREKGLGLGLSIVRRTAQLLGHRIRLVSTPGKGTMFSVTVPLVRMPVERYRTAPSATDRPLAIVAIDDERDVLDALADLLGLWGHRVYAGRSADEVVRALAAEGGGEPAEIDLLLVDYRLGPDSTGLDAVRVLDRHLSRSVPAIIMTGDTSPARLRDIMASGHTVLHKPVDGEALRKAIQVAVFPPLTASTSQPAS